MEHKHNHKMSTRTNSRNNIAGMFRKPPSSVTKMDGPVKLLPSADNDPNHWSSAMKCTICMEYFADPQCLPCGHTFCRKCIKSIIDHARKVRIAPLQKDSKLTFSCPHCRRQILEANYNKYTSKNVVVENILESWKGSPEYSSFTVTKAESETQTTDNNRENHSTSDSCMQTDGSGLTTSITQTHTLRQTIPEECDFVLRLQELGQVMRKHQRFGMSSAPSQNCSSTIEDTLYTLQDNLLPGDNFKFGEYELHTLPVVPPNSKGSPSLEHTLAKIFAM